MLSPSLLLAPAVTAPLPTFRSLFPAVQPEPRRRYPRTTASMARTERLECLPFGGSETR